MFTGLIEETGKIKNCIKSSEGMELYICCKKILEGMRIGDSISINGACQTVISVNGDGFSSQASNETLSVTNFSNLKINEEVNLERALTINTRIAGHIVSGHIDCTARLIKSQNDGFCIRLFFKLPKEHSKYVVKKGSIAVNGVSLTVASIEDDVFSVELIPETLKTVNLSSLKENAIVNIETDRLEKHLHSVL